MKNIKHKICLLLLAISAGALLLGCNKSVDLPPAPLDTKSGLESLASAYTAESSNMPIAPTQMNAQAKKQFLIDVFKRANFSYSKTLQSFKQRQDNNNSRNIKDLAELLALPHKNISNQSRSELYSEQELSAIKQIDKILN